jgi:hypothetical protein
MSKSQQQPVVSNGPRSPLQNVEVKQTRNLQMPAAAQRQAHGTREQVDRMRHNAAVPDDAWVEMDDVVYDTMDDTLVLINDLREAGLVHETTLRAKSTEWHQKGDTHSHTVAMDPEATDDEGSTTFTLTGAPLPVVMESFSIGMRDRPVSGPVTGEDFDTMEVDAAGRAVAEGLEYMGFHGWPASEPGDGYTLHGLTNHPDVNTGNLADWSASPSEVRSDIRAMRKAIRDDNFNAGNTGFWLYLSEDYEEILDDYDPGGSGDLLIRDRVENLAAIDRIRRADYLPSQSALLFRPTRDVIDLAVAAEEQVVQWTGPGGFTDFFKVMSCICPRAKSSVSGQMGAAYYQTP